MSLRRQSEQLADTVSDYVELEKELLKLELADRSAGLFSILISGILLLFFVGMALLLISLGIAIALMLYFESILAGFGFLAACYSLLGLLVVLRREKWIEEPVKRYLLRKLRPSKHNKSYGNSGSGD